MELRHLRYFIAVAEEVTYSHTQSKTRVWASPPRIPGFAFYSEANAQPHFLY